MSYADERAAVGGLLADWTACPILWPSSDVDPGLLAPSSIPTAPTHYLVVAITRESERRITARGLRQIDGTVRISIWCERNLGDGVVEATAQQLADLVSAWAAPTGWTVLDHGLADPVVDEVGFYGAEFRATYIRFEEGGTGGSG